MVGADCYASKLTQLYICTQSPLQDEHRDMFMRIHIRDLIISITKPIIKLYQFKRNTHQLVHGKR